MASPVGDCADAFFVFFFGDSWTYPLKNVPSIYSLNQSLGARVT